jgi:hypothetical protein
VKQSDFPQLELMRQGIEYRFDISCRDFKVKVRPLSNLEVIEATTNAADAFMKMPENKRISITSSLLNAMYQLEKASSADIGDTATLSMTLLQHMTPDEINHLWKQYVRVTDRVNPSFEEMTTDKIQELVDELKKNSDKPSQLIELSISNLIAVCQHLLKPSAE